MRYSFITDIGKKRIVNEDYCYAKTILVNDKEIGVFILADGMGGHNKGEVASKMAVEKMSEYLLRFYDESEIEDKDIKLLLSRAFYETNKIVYEQANENEIYSGMGTTLIASIINSNNIVIGNVGDSRAYIFRADTLYQLTIDNSFVQELIEKGIINAEDAKNHPQKNVITRAIGTDKNVRVDFYYEQLQKNDIVLICSDGLTNMVEDSEIENILLNSSDINASCTKLLNLANDKGGKDNITIMCITL